jgi:hypothetical protein
LVPDALREPVDPLQPSIHRQVPQGAVPVPEKVFRNRRAIREWTGLIVAEGGIEQVLNVNPLMADEVGQPAFVEKAEGVNPKGQTRFLGVQARTFLFHTEGP